MGKGDMKSRRGKLFAGSFGVRRPKKDKNASSALLKTKEGAVANEKIKKEATSEPKKTAPKKPATTAAKPKKETPKKDSATE